MTLNATWGNLLLGICFLYYSRLEHWKQFEYVDVWLTGTSHWQLTPDRTFSFLLLLSLEMKRVRERRTNLLRLFSGDQPAALLRSRPGGEREIARQRPSGLAMSAQMVNKSQIYEKTIYLFFLWGLFFFFFFFFYGRMIYVHAILLSFYGAFHVWFNLTLWLMSHRWA